MRILISTPLFPPEVAHPAAFSKKLAKHLDQHGYDVVVATFSNHPERLQNVDILQINKDHHVLTKLVLFCLRLLKYVPRQDLIILKQAGFSSFLTLVISKIFRAKILLIMSEDEVEVRIKNQKLSRKSLTIWRVKKIQQYIFNRVNLILFSNESIKSKISKQYNLNNLKTDILEHPEVLDILHYGDEDSAKDKIEVEQNKWNTYVAKIISKTKEYAN